MPFYLRLAFVIFLLIRRQTWTPFLGPGTKASKRLKRSMGDRKSCERRKKGRLIPLSKNPELRAGQMKSRQIGSKSKGPYI